MKDSELHDRIVQLQISLDTLKVSKCTPEENYLSGGNIYVSQNQTKALMRLSELQPEFSPSLRKCWHLKNGLS